MCSPLFQSIWIDHDVPLFPASACWRVSDRVAGGQSKACCGVEHGFGFGSVISN